MAKSNTSSYVVTYELAFDNDNPSSVLDKLEKIAKAIYNDCLNECLKCNCQPKIEPHHQFKNEPPINVLNMVDGSFT